MPSLNNLLSIADIPVLEAFTYPLMRRALAVGLLVSLCAAMLGVILVLKRYALIGHGLGEVGFASNAIASLVGLSAYPMLISIPIVCVSSLMIMRLDRKSKLGGDVLIGIFSTAALAVGVIVSAFTTGYSGLYNSMFGSIYALTKTDVWASAVLSVIVIGVFVLLYNRLFSVTYDETYARAAGMNADAYQFVVSLLTSVTVVLGMRVMGAMMISSFIIFPAVTAKKLARSFKGMIVCAVIVAIVSFMCGMLLSYSVESVNLPTGACVVGVNLILLVLTYAFSMMRPVKK